MILKPITFMLMSVSIAYGQQAVATSSIESDAEKLMALSLSELINLPVVTASRRNETRDATPAHIMVVTRKQIRERRYKNLADLLEDMPGVDFMRGTKSSAYNNITVQGYSGPNKLVVMLDGIRISNPAGGSFPIAENIALYAAKQVEFLYGPAAALYGADAVAGVINIITERSGERKGSWIEVGGGNFGGRETSFMGGLKSDGDIALSFGGHWQRSDRAPLQDYYPAEFAKVDATTFGGVTVVPAALREDYVGGIDSHSLFARMDVSDDVTFGYSRNYFRSLTSTGDKPATALYLDDAPWITQTDTFYGKYRFAPSPSLSGEFVVDYSLQEVEPDSRYVNIYTGFDSGYEYTHGERLSVEQNLDWKLDDSHQVYAGVGFQNFYAIEAHTLPSPYDTSNYPVEQEMLHRNTNLRRTIYDARHSNASLYTQLQSEWNESFSTMAGVRVDNHSAYGSSTSPRLGAVWKQSEQHIFKVLYGEAFRAPSPEESLSHFGAFDGSTDANGLYIGTGFRIPNFDLQPEKARTFSLTWDWRMNRDLNVIANAYHSNIKNLIVTQPSTDTDAIPGAILSNPETKGNAGEQTQQGLDLIVQWHFKLNEAWAGNLWGSASWVRGHIDDEDGIQWELPYVAENKAKLSATFRYYDSFSITPQILAVGTTTNGRKNESMPPERLETPGYTIANLHVGWHRLAEGRATLWFDLYNAFDRRYYAAGGAGSRTFYDMPQQPRTWIMSLEYRF